MRRECRGTRAAGFEQVQRLVDFRRQGIALQAEARQQISEVTALDVQQFQEQVLDFDVMMTSLQATLRRALQGAAVVRVEASDQAGQFHVQVISS